MASRREVLVGAAVALWTACTRSGSETDSTEVQDSGTGPGDTGSPAPACTPAHQPHGSEAEGWTRLALADHPELQTVYSGKALTINATRINVAQVGDGCFVAMGVVCTHEGCTVDYAAQRNQFTCPCHGALYGIDGVPIAGPAPLPLPLYDTDFDGEAVWVRVP